MKPRRYYELYKIVKTLNKAKKISKMLDKKGFDVGLKKFPVEFIPGIMIYVRKRVK